MRFGLGVFRLGGLSISQHYDRVNFLEQMASVDTIEVIEVAMIHTEMVVVAEDTTTGEVRDISPRIERKYYPHICIFSRSRP